MAKTESTFVNMLFVLTTITCISAAILGAVYELTKSPIAEVEKQKQLSAIRMVAPEFDNSPADEKKTIEVDGNTVSVFPAKKGGELVGAAIESFTTNGFSGYIKVMVGFEKDGTIRNYSVLQHQETPGLGSKMQDWFRADKNNQSIIGINPSQTPLTVKKDGGSIDAITAATISSRAFLDAVKRAYEQYLIFENEKGGSTNE